MSNPQKNKGDKAERDAVADVTALVPDLVRGKPERYLGAGRKDDVGDIRVLDDVAIQVKHVKDPSTAIAPSALGAKRQQANKQASEGWDVPFHLGMVKFPGARPGTVRWIATGFDFPVIDPEHAPVVVSTYKQAISLVRLNPYVLFVVPKSGRSPEVYLTSLENWLLSYTRHRDHIHERPDEFSEYWKVREEPKLLLV